MPTFSSRKRQHCFAALTTSLPCSLAAVPANSQSQRAAALAAAAALTKRLQGIGGAATSYRDPRYVTSFITRNAAISCAKDFALGSSAFG